MSTQDSILTALEADLSAWGVTSGVLAQTARLLASQLDEATAERTIVELSRELRQVVKQIRETMPPAGESEVDRFLASIQADGFRG